MGIDPWVISGSPPREPVTGASASRRHALVAAPHHLQAQHLPGAVFNCRQVITAASAADRLARAAMQADFGADGDVLLRFDGVGGGLRRTAGTELADTARELPPGLPLGCYELRGTDDAWGPPAEAVLVPPDSVRCRSLRLGQPRTRTALKRTKGNCQIGVSRIRFDYYEAGYVAGYGHQYSVLIKHWRNAMC